MSGRGTTLTVASSVSNDAHESPRCSAKTSADECATLLEDVPELIENVVLQMDLEQTDSALLVSACELALEGLYAENKISRNEEGGYTAVTKAKKDRRGMIYDDLTETGRYS